MVHIKISVVQLLKNDQSGWGGNFLVVCNFDEIGEFFRPWTMIFSVQHVFKGKMYSEAQYAPKKELGRAIGILVLDFMYPASKYVRHKYVRQIIDTNENHKMIHIGIVFILPETSKKHPYRCHFCTIYFMTIHFLE